MRICTLLISFIASFSFLFGQITYSPNPIEVTADKGTENIQTDFELKNEGVDTVLLAWKMDVLGQPVEWNYYVCDTEICYNFGDSLSTTTRPNVIPPGGSIIVMFHTLPSTVEGEGEYKIEFYDVSTPDSIEVVVPISVNTITSSTANVEVKGLSIFPNPATDFFRINTGALVSTIDIVTVVGKKVSSFAAHQGGYYDVSELSRGIYYVRLLDKKGESIKVMKLKKD